MVSYKRLSPEEVHFSGVPLLQSHDESQDNELKVEDAERPLLSRRPSCSVTTALLTLGGLILVVIGIWLLGTVLWLRSTSSNGVHQPPPPKGQKGNQTQPESCSIIPESWRFDCYPERGVVVTEDLCHARNCCFSHAANEKSGVPWCFYPPEFPSYTLDAIDQTEMGWTGKLLRAQKTYYPKDIEVLKLDVLYESNSRLRLKVRALVWFVSHKNFNLSGKC